MSHTDMLEEDGLAPAFVAAYHRLSRMPLIQVNAQPCVQNGLVREVTQTALSLVFEKNYAEVDSLTSTTLREKARDKLDVTRKSREIAEAACRHAASQAWKVLNPAWCLKLDVMGTNLRETWKGSRACSGNVC
jgi:hypothetical protein